MAWPMGSFVRQWVAGELPHDLLQVLAMGPWPKQPLHHGAGDELSCHVAAGVAHS